MDIDCTKISMNTVTGKKVFPFAMTDDQVEFETIAHHLSVQARWQGATRHPSDPKRLMLSVAEHSVLVMHHVIDVLDRPDLALQALLHDATEAYVPDLIRPLKYSPMFKDSFCGLEDHIWSAVAAHFGLPETLDPVVKIADDAVCHREWIDIVPHAPDAIWKGSLTGPREAADCQIEMLAPYDAYILFKEAFDYAVQVWMERARSELAA